MNTEEKLKIRKNWPFILADLDDVDNISAELYSKCVLNDIDRERIRNEKTRYDKAYLLLSLLPNRSGNAFANFIRACRKHNKDFIADRLEVTKVTEHEKQASESEITNIGQAFLSPVAYEGTGKALEVLEDRICSSPRAKRQKKNESEPVLCEGDANTITATVLTRERTDDRTCVRLAVDTGTCITVVTAFESEKQKLFEDLDLQSANKYTFRNVFAENPENEIFLVHPQFKFLSNSQIDPVSNDTNVRYATVEDLRNLHLYQLTNIKGSFVSEEKCVTSWNPEKRLWLKIGNTLTYIAIPGDDSVNKFHCGDEVIAWCVSKRHTEYKGNIIVSFKAFGLSKIQLGSKEMESIMQGPGNLLKLPIKHFERLPKKSKLNDGYEYYSCNAQIQSHKRKAPFSYMACVNCKKEITEKYRGNCTRCKSSESKETLLLKVSLRYFCEVEQDNNDVVWVVIFSCANYLSKFDDPLSETDFLALNDDEKRANLRGMEKQNIKFQFIVRQSPYEDDDYIVEAIKRLE